MLRILAVATVALLAAVTSAGRRIQPGDYVGIDHPSGELRLRLEPDGRFSLRLAVWDAVVGEFVAQREFMGKWRRCWEGLELRAPGRRVVYVHAPGSVGGWIWRRSSLPTFADGFALLPERRVVSASDDVARGAGDRRRWV